MTAKLIFRAADIQIDGIELDEALSSDWLDDHLNDAQVRASSTESGNAGARSGRVTGRLSRSGEDIVVRARVRAAVETDCARCLEAAPIAVDTGMSLLLRSVPRADARHERPRAKHAEGSRPGRERESAREREFSAEEAELDVYDGETVVLDGFVREAILLEIPNFPLCSEACPGIATARPSADLRPRRASLDAFRPAGTPGAVTIADLVGAADRRRSELSTVVRKKPRLRATTRPIVVRKKIKR